MTTLSRMRFKTHRSDRGQARNVIARRGGDNAPRGAQKMILNLEPSHRSVTWQMSCKCWERQPKQNNALF